MGNDNFSNNLCAFLKLLIILAALKMYYNKDKEQYFNTAKVDKRKDVKGKAIKDNLKYKEKYKQTHNETQVEGKELINFISGNSDNSSMKNKCKIEKNSNIDFHKKQIQIENSNNNNSIKKDIKDITKDDIRKESDNKKNLIGKIPIIISEKSIFVPIETSLDLEEDALEIKGIDNSIYLNEGTLIPFEFEGKSRGKLFIKGFIRNCVRYSTVTCIDDVKIKGDIKYCINYIPFKCTTVISYNYPPNLIKHQSIQNLIITNSSEFKSDECNYKVRCGEPIYCNMMKVKIFGNKECCNKKLLHHKFAREATFSILKEKMIVQLVLQLIQKQDVKLNY